MCLALLLGLTNVATVRQAYVESPIFSTFSVLFLTDMDGDLLNGLEFFPPTDKPATSVAVAAPGLGIYQNEESVDFSSWILEACNEVPTVVSVPSPRTNTTTTQPRFREAPGVTNACSDAFSFRSFCTPPPNPTINMYDSENSATSGISLPHSRTTITSLSEHGSLLLGNQLVGSRPAPGKAAKKSKKKVMDKNTTEYREKRERNNVAVRKSREKNRHQIMETQERVKELEDENSALQSKITLLSKELKVLKDLFASAGVSQPPSRCVKPEPK